MTPHDDPFIAPIQQILLSGQQPVFPVGCKSKPGLIPAQGVALLELSDYQGIAAYNPWEYLITARAGTRISELQDALKQHGQYLPFDPQFIADGATLGGTIASGISGPDRLLYGGVRDFVMEVAMLDGLGKFVRGGGKVVKNAAGFDSPKMMVGSYGRMGILTEVTLKVFPAPQAYATGQLECSSIEQAVAACQQILSKSFPIQGLDIDANHLVTIRLAAPASCLANALARVQQAIDRRIRSRFGDEHDDLREELGRWLQSQPNPEQCLIRAAVSPTDLSRLNQLLVEVDGIDFLHCGGGTTTWIKSARDKLPDLDSGLRRLGISAVVVRGQADRAFLGDLGWQLMASRIQAAVDPNSRFASWTSRSLNEVHR